MSGRNLAIRMKEYEDISRAYLTRRMPIIIRVDGRAFHTFTRKVKCEKPFDAAFIERMQKVALKLCEEIQGAKIAYVQSDEISLFLSTYDNLDTEPWFGGCVQKIVSIAASLATATFNWQSPYHVPAHFDARCFILPHAEVTNYFIWRQQDWIRNSVEMLARAYFSHKQLHKVNNKQMQEMLFMQKGVNWSELPHHLKNGTAIVEREGKWAPDMNTPVFSQNQEYVEDLIIPGKEAENGQ